MDDKVLQDLLQQLIEGQQKKLEAFARQFIPNITSDDLLQPNDYPELENNPYFRYEEGIMEGLKSVQAALFALLKEKKS